MDLRGCLDEILEVCSEKEVPKIHELAVVLILDVDYTPPVLTTANLLAVHNDRLFGADNRERNEVLQIILA